MFSKNTHLDQKKYHISDVGSFLIEENLLIWIHWNIETLCPVIQQTCNICWGYVVEEPCELLKLQCVKLRHCGKNEVRGTRGTQNMAVCKLMINKHETICMDINCNDVGVPWYSLMKNCNRRDGWCYPLRLKNWEKSLFLDLYVCVGIFFLNRPFWSKYAVVRGPLAGLSSWNSPGTYMTIRSDSPVLLTLRRLIHFLEMSSHAVLVWKLAYSPHHHWLTTLSMPHLPVMHMRSFPSIQGMFHDKLHEKVFHPIEHWL